MIACVSPARTVRSTPRRISFRPPSVSTETCRSRISRMDMMVLQFSRSGDGHEDVVAFDGHGVDGDRPGGRWAARQASAQIEAGTVQPALERAAVDLAL